jgi:hypothetical protein
MDGSAGPATHVSARAHADAAAPSRQRSWPGGPRAVSATGATAPTARSSRNAPSAAYTVARPFACPTAGRFASPAGRADGPCTPACPAGRRLPQPSSTSRAPTATCATPGFGVRDERAAAVGASARSPATLTAISPASATAATEDRNGPAHVADGYGRANGSPPASRSATPATPATSVPG